MITVLAVVGAGFPAAAQQPAYQTPLYSSQPPAALDKNYGLPTFGMPGAEVPQQKTMATVKDAPEKPDFFAGSTAIALPKARVPVGTESRSETPLFTTSQGSTTGETPLFTTSQGSTTGETPMFTTDQGIGLGGSSRSTGDR